MNTLRGISSHIQVKMRLHRSESFKTAASAWARPLTVRFSSAYSQTLCPPGCRAGKGQIYNMNQDLTQGNPGTVLWKFTLPLFGSVIFQQIYNIADSVIAGKFVGEDALAAIGASYPITMIFMAVAIGANVGCSVVVSQLFGAKMIKEMKTAVSTTLLASVVLSLVLTAAGILTSTLLLDVLQTPGNILADAETYFSIYIAGFPFLFFYNVCTGIFTSLGDSRTPLWFLIGSSVLNIVLDIVFVTVFDWKVAGVAWATFIAQGLACILAFLVILLRLRRFRVDNYPKISLSMLKQISRIAVPSIIQNSFVSVGNIFVQGMVNRFGSSVIAGYSAAVKLNTFSVSAFTTFGNGMSSFTAQHIGARKVDRIRQGFRSGILIALSFAIPFVLAYLLFGDAAIRLFMKEQTKEAVEAGTQFLYTVAPFYLLVGIKLVTDGVLRGAGAVRQFMATTFVDLLLRVLLAYILSGSLGPLGIWLSWPVGWIVSSILSLMFYRQGSWAMLKGPADEREEAEGKTAK